MRIALVAPLVSPIDTRHPPLGGAQAVVGDLASGLANRGHTVTLLAAGGSFVLGVETPSLGVDHSGLVPADFSRPAERTDTAAQARAFRRVREWLQETRGHIDIVHAHAFDAPAFQQLDGLQLPVIHTLHLPPIDAEVVRAARAASRSATLAAVSEAGRREWETEHVPIGAILTAGLDMSLIPFREQSDGYLLFAGRLTPEKGPDRAIDVAAELGRSLLIVGEVYDQQFYAAAISPRVDFRPEWQPGDPLGAGPTYVGSRPRAVLWSIMAGAAGVLMPVRWDEPFGLVALEAQAAGAPVIAYRRGGIAEVVGHGRGGWLVAPDDERAFIRAVEDLDRLDRAGCRAWAEERFSLEAMLSAHEVLYDRVRGGNA